MHINADATSLNNDPDIDDIRANLSLANKDPFKFSHGLTGVNQPSNYYFARILLATAVVPILLALAYRILLDVQHHRRRAVGTAQHRPQSLFRNKSHTSWASIKHSFLYAPIWTRRQKDRSCAASTRSNTNPLTRPQFFIITIYTISNIAYCTVIPSRPESQPQRLAEVRGRCGTLATFNLILAILFALRNNPLIHMLHVSYDTFNLFHRWAARLVVLESVAHVGAFAINTYRVTYDGHAGWDSISWVLQHSLSYRTGLTAFIAFLFLIAHSISFLRHAFYDTFFTLHRLSVLIAISGLYFHLAQHALPQLPWIYFITVLLTAELLIRMYRILHYNWSWKHHTWTHVTLEALPGEATRVTFTLPRSWNSTPGSHVHVYFPSVAPWSSHPFSIAWTQSDSIGYTNIDPEKLPFSAQDSDLDTGPSTISCIIRAHAGMTRILFNRASRGTVTSRWVAIEGPYGVFHALDSYGTVVLFAAGVGITHQLLFVRELLAGRTSGSAATQKIVLVWCVRDVEALGWVEPWLEKIADMEGFSEVAKVRVYVSGTSSVTRDVPSYLQFRHGRCDPQEVLDEEMVAQTDAMAVTVCGPASFNSSVREAVRKRLCVRDMDFFEESFSY